MERPGDDELMKAAEKRAANLAGWWSHVSVFIIVALVLITINLLTWGGYFWAIWPIMAWGVGIAFHSLNVFGPQFGNEWQKQKARQLVERDRMRARARYAEGATPAPYAGTAQRPVPPQPSAPANLRELTAHASDEVDRLRRVARQIPTPDSRREALEVLASADQIVAALGDGQGNEEMARTFLDRYLGPTSTILVRYQRLAGRNIPSAQPALRRVEEHDLPLLNRRMRELHNQLHQGDVIDLQVASEMLAFELDEPDPSGPSMEVGAEHRPSQGALRGTDT